MATDMGPVTGIFTILLMILSVISVAGRIFTKTLVIRSLDTADYIILIALLLVLGQGSAVLVAVSNGLGHSASSVVNFNTQRLEKSLYAASVLNIPTLVSIKISIVFFVHSLTPSLKHRLSGSALGGVILLWGLSSEVAAATQCIRPPPWTRFNRECNGRVAFWNSFYALNIVTDSLLILWPCAIVMKLRTNIWRRSGIMLCFGIRILVIGAIIAQIISLERTRATQDSPTHSWQLIICTQIVQGLSISTACVPYLKPFLESLTSSVLDPNVNSRLGGVSHQDTTKPSILRSWVKFPSNVNETDISATSAPSLPLQQFTEPRSPSKDGDGNSEANSMSSRTYILERNMLVSKEIGD